MLKYLIQCSNKNQVRSAMAFEKLASKIKRLSFSSSCSGEISESSDSSEEEINDPRDLIVKRPEDYSDCRVFTLKNGIKCLLISDGDQDELVDPDSAHKSAAGLSVRVGSIQEPSDIPGLAHLLEHMLFMGCEKYPCENDYDNFLSQHGGSSNATTDYELTTYLFDVSTPYFEDALDRFAHQFICPMIKKSSVKREIEAVDSEYMEGLQSDTQKLEAIYISLIQPDHPFNRFTAGNKETLLENPDVITEELVKFHEQFYSANSMFLCLISPEPLDMLEKMTKVFEEIPNKNTLPISLEDYPLPKINCNFIQYYPVKDKTKLMLIWFLKPQMKNYRSKPNDYVSWCIGHEGKGSLLSALKSKGYATSVECGTSAGGFDESSNFTRLDIDIRLSDKGLEMYRDVITLVFQYIQMLRKKLPCARIYKEMEKIHKIDFDNMEEEDPYERVEDLVENMTVYPPKHYLSGPELLFEYSPDLIMDVVNSLTPQSVTVVLQSKTFKDECTQTEKWYKGKYLSGELDAKFIQMLTRVSGGDFKLPEPNPYIPEDLDIKEISVEGPPSAPSLITAERSHKTWFYKDDVFEQPECFIYIHLLSKNVGSNINEFALNSLNLVLLENRVAEIFYSAKLAGLEAEVDIQKDGWHFKFNGYNDKMLKFFRKFIYEIFDGVDNVFNFTAVKDNTVKSLRMANMKPLSYASELRKGLIYRDFYTSDAIAEALSAISESDIKHHKARDTGPFFAECLGGGNITPDELRKFVTYFTRKIRLLRDDNVLPESEFPQPRVYKFPHGRFLMSRNNINPDDVNSVVVNYYQHDAVNFRDTVILGVIEGLIEEPAFNQLRTRLQLGYSITVDNHESNGVTGFSITVLTQASKHTTNEINVYIECFLEWFQDYLVDMEEQCFEERIEQFVRAKVLPNHTIDEDMDQVWMEIVTQEYIFDRDQRMAEIMRKLTKKEVLEFYQKLFLGDVRKVSIQVAGNPHGTASSSVGEEAPSPPHYNGVESESSDASLEPDFPDMLPLRKEELVSRKEDMIEISDSETFQKQCTLLPVLRMVTQVVTVDVTNCNR